MTRGSLVSVVFAILAWFGSGGTVHTAELLPVRASYAAIGGVFAPVWIAQDYDLFTKYGAAVDLKFMPPVVGTQALIAKSLDVVAPSGEFMEAALSGPRVRSCFLLSTLGSERVSNRSMSQHFSERSKVQIFTD